MGVRHVVQGSLRQEGSKIRLQLTLTDGESGVRRWSEAFHTDRAQLAQACQRLRGSDERTLVAALYLRSTSERPRNVVADRVAADGPGDAGFAQWYRVSRARTCSPQGVVRPAP